jgi:hypothetical protein
MATYFEQKDQFFQAGKHYAKAGDYVNALRTLMMVSPSSAESIQLAIDLVSELFIFIRYLYKL